MTSTQSLSAALSRLDSVSSPPSNISSMVLPLLQREADCSYVVTTQLPHRAHIIYSTLHQPCALPTPINSVNDLNSEAQQPSSAASSHHQRKVWVVAPAIIVAIAFSYCVWKFCYERSRLGVRRRGRRGAHAQSGQFDISPQTPRPRETRQILLENETEVGVHKTNRVYDYGKQKWTDTPGTKARKGDLKKGSHLTEPSEQAWPHACTGDESPSVIRAAKAPPTQPPPEWRDEDSRPIPSHPSPTPSPNRPPPSQPPPSWPPSMSSAARREAWNEIRAERRRVELHSPSFASYIAEPDPAGMSSDFSEDTLVSSQSSPPKTGLPKKQMEQMEIDDGYRRGARDTQRGGIQWILETLGVFRMGKWAWQPGRR